MTQNNVEFPHGIGFQCVNCGSCCKAHPSDVNSKEQKKIEAKGFTDFLEGSDGDVTRRIRAKNDGSCLFLSKDNGCAIYDARPAACKLEPLMVTDYDYENNKIKLEINPAALCDPVMSCKGLSLTGKMPEGDMGEAAQTTIQEALESFSRQKKLPVTSKEVAFLTRQYFIQAYIIASAFAEAVSRLAQDEKRDRSAKTETSP
jgi:Fe-S-cluster containining protein